MLLTTKLATPPPVDVLVPRPRLTDRLQAEGRRLTLLSAPAGSGKTTLLAEWIDRDHPAVAWLSLDRRDNRVKRFLAHLAAACLEVRPALASAMSSDPESTELAVDEVVLEGLLNGLSALDEPFTLVLDDYHFIEEEAVHRAVEFLVEHQPPGLHLVVSSRCDPPLPLARLRVRRRLREIRGADLRFTPEESAALLSQMLGTALPQEEVETLCARTEGWAAGLQLAGLSLRGMEDHQALIAGFRGDHRHIVDYLTDEVLAGLDEELRDFLLRTSIVERLCAPLCEALTGRTGAQERLEFLEKANLFVISLDQRREWYRYHHLFADLLRSRLRGHLDRAGVARLHLEATRWHAVEGLPEAAIEHALQATAEGAEDATTEEALELLTDLIEGHGHHIFTRARRFEVEAWLDRLPEERKLARPRLALLTAKVLIINQRRGEAEGYLEAAEAAFDAGTVPGDEVGRTALRGEILVARASQALRRWEFDAVVRDVEEALQLLPTDDLANRSHSALLLGLARRCLADHEPAWHALQEAATLGLRIGDPLTMVCAWAALGRLRLSQGRLREAEVVCQRGLDLCRERRWERLPILMVLQTNLGEIFWERGAEETRGVLERVLSAAETASTPRSEIRREAPEAASLLLRLLDFAPPDTSEDTGTVEPCTVPPESRLLPVLDSLALLQARECFLRGDAAAVRRWLDREGVDPEDAMTPWEHAVYLMLARVLLAEKRPAQALELLTRLGPAVERAGQVRLAIEVYAVQALVRQQKGATAKALEALRRALELATPEGAVRVFLELGPPLAALMKPLAAEFPALVTRVLGATPPPTRIADSRLLEPLSEREHEVLELLYGGLSNKEIAARLFLSANTVKTHIRNIYGKIGASSRSQAIVRVRELELL